MPALTRFCHCAVPENTVSIPTPRLMEIQRGRGVSKAQFFRGKYDAKLKFQEQSGGFHTKKPSVGGMDIL